MDLDDDELEATKIINKTIDVNKDIALLEEFADLCKRGFNKENQVKEGYAVKRVIKKLKELEVLEDDLKDKRVVYIDTPEFTESYIPQRKIKDKIEEAKNNKKAGNTAYEYTEEDVWDIVKDVLENLLEVK